MSGVNVQNILGTNYGCKLHDFEIIYPNRSLSSHVPCGLKYYVAEIITAVQFITESDFFLDQYGATRDVCLLDNYIAYLYVYECTEFERIGSGLVTDQCR